MMPEQRATLFYINHATLNLLRGSLRESKLILRFMFYTADITCCQHPALLFPLREYRTIAPANRKDNTKICTSKKNNKNLYSLPLKFL
jgi:hypothetical protein